MRFSVKEFKLMGKYFDCIIGFIVIFYYEFVYKMFLFWR